MDKNKHKSVDDLYIGYSNIYIKNYYEKFKIKVAEINKQCDNIMFLNDAFLEAYYGVYNSYISFDHELDNKKLNVLIKHLEGMHDDIVLEERMKIVKKAIELKKASL